MNLSLTPTPEDAERISRSMRVLSYEEAKEGVSRYVEEPFHEKGELTRWDLSFAEYIKEHKNSKLLFCRYGKSVGIVSSPVDHHGIWAAQREGTLSKGIVPDHLVTFLEGLAKSKGLVRKTNIGQNLLGIAPGAGFQPILVRNKRENDNKNAILLRIATPQTLSYIISYSVTTVPTVRAFSPHHSLVQTQPGRLNYTRIEKLRESSHGGHGGHGGSLVQWSSGSSSCLRPLTISQA